LFVFLYHIKSTNNENKANIINKKLFIMKSEVKINAFVAYGNSTSELSKSGLIAGITYVRTTIIAKNKKINIIIGYIKAHFTLFFNSYIFFKSSLILAKDSTSAQVVSHASIIDISLLSKIWGNFFIDLEKESHEEI
jgi:hypothetical protein